MGDGIEKNNLIKLSETLNIKNKVIFIGRCNQEKVALIASRAKIGIFLCPNESFGLAAVESMACGTPVIGINTGGISETVMDGKTGALITDNENMIAEKIHQLLQNQELLSEYSQNAVNHARNSFNWDNEAMKLSVFLKSLK
jgi:glycosyltransferase involved in cell wall biosynthesis